MTPPHWFRFQLGLYRFTPPTSPHLAFTLAPPALLSLSHPPIAACVLVTLVLAESLSAQSRKLVRCFMGKAHSTRNVLRAKITLRTYE